MYLSQNEASSPASRQVAYVVRLKDLSDGDYMTQEGWDPNYVQTRWGGKVSRVHLVGTVVEVGNNMCIVDDGSATMAVRSFDQSLPELQVGDLVRVVGRPRVYNDQLYLSSEIVVKLEDTKWLTWHQTLLEYFAKERPEVPEQEDVHVDEITEEENDYEPILSMIDEMDSGEGVDMQAVKEKLEVPDPQALLDKLLLHGEIFEIKPGRIKVLR